MNVFNLRFQMSKKIKIIKTIYPSGSPSFNDWMIYIHTEIRKLKHVETNNKQTKNESTNEKINNDY